METSENIFQFDFYFLNRRYHAQLVPVCAIDDATGPTPVPATQLFFVRIQGPHDTKFFALHRAGDLTWSADGCFGSIVDNNIVQILGKYLDEHALL